MNPELWTLPLALAGGAALGLFFFGGLKWTLARALGAPAAGLWLAASMLLRMAVTLAGFWLAGGGDWLRLLLCLGGFVAVRVAYARGAAPEAGHA